MEAVRHDAKTQRFELEDEGRRSTLDYVLRDGRMVITHTFVPAELRGQGRAEKLVHAALAFARTAALEVVPQCGYVAAYLRRHPEEGAPPGAAE